MMNRVAIPFLFAITCSQLSAQSILEMNWDACNSYKAADKVLNQVYNQVLRARVADKNFVDAFKAAERAWLVFRDAHLNAVYPDPDPLVAYGHINPACRCALLEAMTLERTKELRKLWIEGTGEDDACAGSSARNTEVQPQQTPKQKH
jgi:uncharacterized protein YecT (DUF1311 family)